MIFIPLGLGFRFYLWIKGKKNMYPNLNDADEPVCVVSWARFYADPLTRGAH